MSMKEKIEALEKEFKGIFTKEDLECYREDTLDYLISKTITQKEGQKDGKQAKNKKP